MDVSAQEEGEIWINAALCVPSLPASRRAHYPFSRGGALVYRLKLAVVLLNAAAALWRREEPCHLFSLLLNCWLILVTCEGVYKNYPWREPLTIWMWKLCGAIPCSLVLLSLCGALLLLVLLCRGVDCELPHPLAAVAVGWLCCMMSWPMVRENWHRGERSEYDYDYDHFSHRRSYSLTLPGPFRVIFAALRSPSLLTFLAALATSSLVALFLPEGWPADVGSLAAGVLLLASFAVLFCHRLLEDVRPTLAAWKEEEADYAEMIGNCLGNANTSLLLSGIPVEGTISFDRLSVHLPLLLREVEILRKSSMTLPESLTEELENLTTSHEVLEFRRVLDDYGPYTTQCCVS